MNTGSFGALTYALDDKVDLLMALTMLATASIGSQVGTMATKVVDGSRIRFLYALIVLAGSFSLALDQVSEAAESVHFLSSVGAVVLLGAAGIMCLFIAGLVVASKVKNNREAVTVDGRAGNT